MDMGCKKRVDLTDMVKDGKVSWHVPELNVRRFQAG
jgi:hypothetical protein